MHTPDGFLTGWICYACLAVAVSAIAYSIYKLRNVTKEAAMQMAGLAAIIFAMQMLNFPITNGTSGHLIGASLAAIMFGPYAGIVVLASVLFVQAAIFGDGGMLALGANIINMGIVASFTAHMVYEKMGRSVYAVIAASWASVVAAALSASLLLGMSGTIEYNLVLPAMLLTHAIIGVGEGLMTMGIKYLYSDAKSITLAVTGAFLVMALAIPLASENPDGLDSVAINLGFYENAIELYNAPLPDYMSSNYLQTIAAGTLGMIAVFATAYLAFTGKAFLTKTA
jgi:cobalt/nickel transport system permease protein